MDERSLKQDIYCGEMEFDLVLFGVIMFGDPYKYQNGEDLNTKMMGMTITWTLGA